MKRRLWFTMAFAGLCLGASAAGDALRFNAENYTLKSLQMPDGEVVSYKAYEGIYYVKNVEDSTYQTLNLYVPFGVKDTDSVPILLRTYVGGYMASTAKTPSATDATGRALKEGYVVCIPGSRGANSVVKRNEEEVYTGIAPNGLLDLKAAVRYLHYNDEVMPGDANRIFTDGTSAGGAMSALLGATGNGKDYEPYLEKMGAAPARDEVFAAICYCPITDLEHADCEYEWLYSCTNDGIRGLDESQKAVSEELAALCPDYLRSLNLTTPSGEKLTADNYRNYLKNLLIASMQRALQEGAEIPDSIGVVFYQEKQDFMGAGPRRSRPSGERRFPEGLDGREAPSFGPAGRPPRMELHTDFVADLNLDRYLTYVASVTPLKTPPAFDQEGVLVETASPENKVFGNAQGESANFTTFSLQRRTKDSNAVLDEELRHRIYLMNPMNFIGGDSQTTLAGHWYIRHGARDRDTSFLVPVNLATKLQNTGVEVDFALPWNRPHTGDYNLDDLFAWMKRVAEGK